MNNNRKSKPLIYTIVVTYNGKQWIDRCFNSLFRSTVQQKIIAIDNASSDGTPDLIRERYPQVDLIETGVNLGFGKANNIGMKTAFKDNADFVFLLNQDAWVEPNTMALLISASQNYRQFGILSPMHLTGSGTSLDLNFSYCLMESTAKEIIEDNLLQKKRCVYEINMVNAAAWLITRDCLKTVGLFDPLFTHYGEDNDYVLRTIFHNFSIGIVFDSRIYHDRENRKNMSFRQLLNYNYINNLYILKNINKPFLECLQKYITVSIRKVAKGIITVKFNLLIIEIYNFFRIIKLLNRINTNRKISKSKNGAFIEEGYVLE